MPQNALSPGWFILPVLLALSPADSKSVLGGEPGAPNKGQPFRLDYINVKRGYMFFGPDPKVDKMLFNPKEEHLKSGKFEISVSRAYYAHKAVMTVEAPDTVEDGQSVTIKATADATWDLTPKEPLTSSGLEVGIGGGYGVKGDRKDLSATPKEPFKSGPYSLKAQMSDTVKVGDNLRQFFGGYGPWPPPEKDMEYRSFALNMTTNINGNIGSIETYWYYKRPKAGKIDTKPEPKPGQGPQCLATVLDYSLQFPL